MPIEIDFSDAVALTLSDADVADHIAESGQIDVDEVRSRLLEDEIEIRGLIAPLVQKYSDIEAEIEEVRKEHSALAFPTGWAASFAVITGWLILGAAAAGIGWLLGANFPENFVRDAWSGPAGNWRQLILLAAMALVLSSAVARIRWQLVLLPRIKDQIAQDSRLETKSAELDGQAKAIEQHLHALIVAGAFEIIGRAAPPFFQAHLVLDAKAVGPSSKLKVTSAQGLSEVADKAHETPTPARREILRLIIDLPGGAIGLSGPRGSGKSTILRSLTSANLPLGKKQAIAIYSAAPVEYDARDFLLHLFATLCRQVLKTHGTSEEQGIADGSGDTAGDWLATINRMAPFLRWMGFLLASFALLIAMLTQLPILEVANQAGTGRINLLQAMDLKSGPLLLFGLTALLTGISAQLYFRFRGSGRAATSILSPAFFPLGPARAPSPEPEAPLVVETRRELRDIRFQRSFTSGWSGTFKIPAGFDLARTSSTSLAQRQESFPELVDRFCGYVGRVTQEHGKVVIAIDELDKLKTAEEAEKFINSIKSIFGIRNCFYLVSVSEDALSAFERRGLSLRDAFDSAFDDMRYIGYKRLAGSRRLLSRRVLNLPDPFVCLCHVLSGGLPRDLIRVARAMFEVAAGVRSQQASLKEVGRRLVSQEMAAKIRASRTAMRSVALEPEAGAFATALAEMEEQNLGTSAFRAKAEKLVAKPWTESEAVARGAADAAAFAKLVAIQRELSAYVDFLGVTLTLVNKLATTAGWEAARETDVDGLARARQALESSASVGVMQLARVRANLAP